MSADHQKITPLLARAATWWVAVAIWAGVIFLFSAQQSSGGDLPTISILVRKAAHMIEYAVLFSLLYGALRRHRLGPFSAVSIAAAFAFLYAVSDELHQTFVPGREGKPSDVAIDAAGIVVAAIITWALARRRAGTPAKTL